MSSKLLLVLIVASLAYSAHSRKVRGQQYEPGQPLPKPQSLSQSDTLHYLDAPAFAFQYAPGSVVCDLLSNAFNRYYKIIFHPGQNDNKPTGVSRNSEHKSRQARPMPKNANILKRLAVNVRSPCEDYPSLESDESCNINLQKKKVN
jgi:hypothetical protein